MPLVSDIAIFVLKRDVKLQLTNSTMPPSYIRVRAVVWAYGCGQTDRQTDRHTDRHTDTQTRVTTIHFASSTTHAKCN